MGVFVRKNKRIFYRTLVISYGFDGEVFLSRVFHSELSKKKVVEIQKKWDRLYGGFMKYEMVELS